MEDRLTLVEAVNREPGRSPIGNVTPGSPAEKTLPGFSGQESHFGIFRPIENFLGVTARNLRESTFFEISTADFAQSLHEYCRLV
jgi:hypothetical protein